MRFVVESGSHNNVCFAQKVGGHLKVHARVLVCTRDEAALHGLDEELGKQLALKMR